MHSVLEAQRFPWLHHIEIKLKLDVVLTRSSFRQVFALCIKDRIQHRLEKKKIALCRKETMNVRSGHCTRDPAEQPMLSTFFSVTQLCPSLYGQSVLSSGTGRPGLHGKGTHRVLTVASSEPAPAIPLFSLLFLSQGRGNFRQKRFLRPTAPGMLQG